MMFRMLAATLALGFAGLAFAAKVKVPTVDADGAAFPEQKATVERAIAGGDLFSEISAADKAEVLAALERMETTLAGAADRTQLEQDEERVNELLAKAGRDSRVQCRRSKQIGSNRSTNTCRTVASWRRDSEAARDEVARDRRHGDVGPGEGSPRAAGGRGS